LRNRQAGDNTLVINQENDIAAIIDGLKNIMFRCLYILNDKVNNDENIAQLKQLGK